SGGEDSVMFSTANTIAVITGLAVGFGLLWLLEQSRRHPRAFGLIALIFAAGGGTAFLSYLFSSDARSFVFLLALSLTFGTLLYILLFPSVAKTVFRSWLRT
nr:hypothetical protein [Micromonospora sp. DSM 115978]